MKQTHEPGRISRAQRKASLCVRRAVLTVGALGTTATAMAQALPAVPVSPAPVTQFEYDAEGRPTRVLQSPDGLKFSTTHQYDLLGRRQQTVDARNGTVKLGYDGQDQLLSVTDPRTLTTSYARTGLGGLTQQKSPDTGTTSYALNALGLPDSSTDARGVVSSYTYDKLNRLTKRSLKSGSSTRDLVWTYDQADAAHGYGVGRLTRTSNPEVTTDWRYDQYGQVLQQTQTYGTQVLAVGYSYSPGGQVSSVTYPSGRVVSYSYEQGRLKSISLAPSAGDVSRTLVSGVQYSPFGAARSWQWNLNAGPVTHERVFDSYGRLVRYPLGKVVRDLTYDAADRISGYTHYDAVSGAKQTAIDQLFAYDELGRLIMATQGTQNWAYAYDANGNRTQASNPSGTRVYTTESMSNRLTGVSNPQRSFTYDKAGNTLTDVGNGASSYSAVYNLEGRLAGLPVRLENRSFAYDVSGLRIAFVRYDSRRYYAYDQNRQLLGEYSEGPSGLRPTAEYIWMDGQPIAVVRPKPGSAPTAPNSEQEVFFLHPDHLGAPRVALDLNGQLRWRWMGGEPFGVLPPEDNPSSLGPLYVGLRFPGQVVDSLVGLHYNVFRDYDASVGRYVQSDPIGLGGGINTYAYVEGNPLSGTDPNGLETCVIVTRNGMGFADHASLYMSRGSDSGGPAIYDPSGSYARSIDPGNGDVLTGRNADLGKYADFYKKHDGSATDKTCKDTSKEEEKRLFEKSIDMGGQAGPRCAISVSNVLSGSKYYRSVTPGTFFPGNLFNDAKKP